MLEHQLMKMYMDCGVTDQRFLAPLNSEFSGQLHAWFVDRKEHNPSRTWKGAYIMQLIWTLWRRELCDRNQTADFERVASCIFITLSKYFISFSETSIKVSLIWKEHIFVEKTEINAPDVYKNTTYMLWRGSNECKTGLYIGWKVLRRREGITDDE